jgi:hypothetical protein
VPLSRNAVPASGVGFERHGGIQCQGTGDSLLPHPAAGSYRPIRATRSNYG